MIRHRPSIRWQAPLLAAAALVGAAGVARAHAVLLESKPAAKETVPGPDVDVRLRFNVRVDAARSRLSLLLPDQSVRELTLDAQTEPQSLACRATGLKAGAHRLRWQVLATDGHITRGEVPFDVK